MEASIILEFEKWTQNHNNNIKWIKSCDYGGEGPKPPADAHAEHVVYLAVLPVTAETRIPFARWTADANARMRIVPEAAPADVNAPIRFVRSNAPIAEPPAAKVKRAYCPAMHMIEYNYCPACGNRETCICDEEEIDEAMMRGGPEW